MSPLGDIFHHFMCTHPLHSHLHPQEEWYRCAETELSKEKKHGDKLVCIIRTFDVNPGSAGSGQGGTTVDTGKGGESVDEGKFSYAKSVVCYVVPRWTCREEGILQYQRVIFGAPCTCKNQFGFPIHTKTYPRPVLHFRASAMPNEIVLTSIIRTSSASMANSAAPASFSSSRSTLSLRRFRTLVTFPSGDAGRLGGPSTSVCCYAYSASRCA